MGLISQVSAQMKGNCMSNQKEDKIVIILNSKLVRGKSSTDSPQRMLDRNQSSHILKYVYHTVWKQTIVNRKNVGWKLYEIEKLN